MDQTRIMRTGFVVAMTGLVTAVILTACGGGDDGGSNLGSGGGSNDAFIAKVTAVAATTADNTEPESTDSIVATSPETTEPGTVVF